MPSKNSRRLLAHVIETFMSFGEEPLGSMQRDSYRPRWPNVASWIRRSVNRPQDVDPNRPLELADPSELYAGPRCRHR